MKKIGFFEKWNDKAKCIEFSITSLQMAVLTVFTMIFIIFYFIIKNHSVTLESIGLVLVMFVACFTPKLLKDLTGFKNLKK
jgi:hypothetical protein